MLSVIYAECHKQTHCAECRYAECHYAECHYAECRYAECHYAECRGAVLLAATVNVISCKGFFQRPGQCYKTFYGRKLRLFVLSYSDCPWKAFPA
jgi:hypothetical protein